MVKLENICSYLAVAMTSPRCLGPNFTAFTLPLDSIKGFIRFHLVEESDSQIKTRLSWEQEARILPYSGWACEYRVIT